MDTPMRSALNCILRDKIDGLLKTLTYREREIIRLRYGLGDGYTYTLEEVGRIFKVTRERVRQIEAKAVRKLQNPMRSSQLEGFVPDELETDVLRESKEQPANSIVPENATGSTSPAQIPNENLDSNANEIPFWQMSRKENEQPLEQASFQLFEDSIG